MGLKDLINKGKCLIGLHQGEWRVRAVRTKRRECLIEDLVRSPSLHEASLCDPDQKVAQSIGVENVRVVHHYE